MSYKINDLSFSKICPCKIISCYFTVNDKSFEGEKFCGLLGSSGMWGKFRDFFPSPLSYIHGFPTLRAIQLKLRVPHVNSP